MKYIILFINFKNLFFLMNVILLAAGKGKRLNPETSNLPKPLVKINKNKTIFDTSPGQVVSLIPSSSDTKITTSGLQYTLQKEKLSTPTQGISNVAINTSFSIEATEWVWVIINHEK